MGGSAPRVPTAQEQAQANIMQAEAENRMQEEAAARERQRLADERTALIAKAQPLQAAAYNNALSYGTNQINRMGYDPTLVAKYGLQDAYNSAVDQARGTIAEDSLTPTYANNTMWSDALSQATGARRTDLLNQLNAFAGDNYAMSTFGNTSDDALLNEVLGEQYGDTLSTLNAQRDRGQLNDAGYSKAMSLLGNQKSSALASLQDLGLGVLSGYRDDINNSRENELNKIGQLGFGDRYNLDNFRTSLDQLVSDRQGSMRGDILAAIGDQSFFDPNAIIGKAGSLQGYYNPTTPLATSATGTDEGSLLDQTTKKNLNQVF